MKILVIDDQPTELRLLKAVLTAGGHAVVEVSSAEQALEEIAHGHPDLVLVDMNMPGIDGMALTRAIKSDPQTRGIPVVAMTAVPEHFPESQAAAAGCDAYMTKPLNVLSLSRELEEVLPQDSSR